MAYFGYGYSRSNWVSVQQHDLVTKVATLAIEALEKGTSLETLTKKYPTVKKWVEDTSATRAAEAVRLAKETARQERADKRAAALKIAQNKILATMSEEEIIACGFGKKVSEK